MKKTTTIREKIAVRAYYAWLDGSSGTAEENWLAAEQIEQAYAERRAAAARKAAETRKVKSTVTSPIVVTAVKRRPTLRFPTAH